MSTERRGLGALGMDDFTEMCGFFSLDHEDPAFTASLKNVLRVFIFLTFLTVLRKVFIFKIAISYTVAVESRDLTAFCH